MGEKIVKAIGKYYGVLLKIQEVRRINKEEKLRMKKLKEKIRLKREFIVKEKRQKSVIGERSNSGMGLIGKKVLKDGNIQQNQQDRTNI